MTRHQSTLQRGPLTAYLIAALETSAFPVGDTNSPTEPFAWQGEPNAEGTNFIPWIELMSGPSRLNAMQGFGDTGVDWISSYNVFYAGVNRSQTSTLADRMRLLLNNTARNQIVTDDGTMTVLKITCTAVGSTVKVSSTIPDYFTQTDTFEVWTTKEL